MSIFSFSKSINPNFLSLKKGEKVSMNLKVTVADISGSNIKFHLSEIDVQGDKSRRHPSAVMRDAYVEHRDFHVEHAG